MDLSKSLGFVFEDKRWIEKFLIAVLITFLGGFFSFTLIAPLAASALLLGYGVEIVRRVRARDPQPLPEWEDFGALFIDGVKLFALYLIFALPLIVLFSPGLVLVSLFNETSVESVAVILSSCLFFLALLYAIFYTFLIPAITVRYAETGDFTDSLDVTWLWEFTRDNAGQVIGAVIIAWIVAFVANFVGLLVCGFGLFFTSVWAFLVQSHLFAQIGLPAERETPTSAPDEPEPPDFAPPAEEDLAAPADDDIAVG